MAFDKDPVVDENSKRSEESVNYVRSLLTRKGGFISREEVPDYGVDLDVELITEGQSASSQKFAVQIKSAMQLNTVTRAGVPYLSFSFKTSRLGYLARRPPCYGIIILYNESSGLAYYDYVEDIIALLDEADDKSQWRQQDSVNIWLRVQDFNQNSIQNIHQKFLSRHRNHIQMTRKHGKEFSIPFLENASKIRDAEFNVNNAKDIRRLLIDHGSLLFNESQFSTLLRLFDLLPRQSLNNSAELLFLAAVTYSQVGNVIEAEYYLRKVNKCANELSDEHRALLEFSAIHLEFLKGNVSYDTLSIRFKSIAASQCSVENQLTLEINSLFAELYNNLDGEEYDVETENQIEALFLKIESTGLDAAKKHLLNTLLSALQHSLGLSAYLTYYTKYKIKQSLGIIVSKSERIHYGLKYFNLIEGAQKTVNQAYEFAVQNEFHLLRANAGLQLAMQFVALQSGMLMVPDYNFSKKEPKKFEALCITNQNLAIEALNSFLDFKLFEKAQKSLGTAIDIHKLSMILTNKPLGTKSENEMITILRDIETTYELSPYSFTTDEILNRLNEVKNPQKDLALFTDPELETFARRVHREYELPIDRLKNIMDDMKLVRTFRQRCNHPELILQQDMSHTLSKESLYATCPDYIVTNIKNGKNTPPSSNVELLLRYVPDLLK